VQVEAVRRDRHDRLPAASVAPRHGRQVRYILLLSVQWRARLRAIPL